MNTLLPFPLPDASRQDPAILHQAIARRAEEIWLELGSPSGRDLEIWLEAEAELRATLEHTYRYPHLPEVG